MIKDGEEAEGDGQHGGQSGFLARFLTMKGWLEWGRKLWQCAGRGNFDEVLNGGEEMTEEMQDGRERSAGEGNGLLSAFLGRKWCGPFRS